MEQATAGAATSLLAQLGIAGLGIVVIAAIAFWWLKASRDLRDEKEGVIERQSKLIGELIDERDKYKEAYLACKYPGSGHDPFTEGQPE